MCIHMYESVYNKYRELLSGGPAFPISHIESTPTRISIEVRVYKRCRGTNMTHYGWERVFRVREIINSLFTLPASNPLHSRLSLCLFWFGLDLYIELSDIIISRNKKQKEKLPLNYVHRSESRFDRKFDPICWIFWSSVFALSFPLISGFGALGADGKCWFSRFLVFRVGWKKFWRIDRCVGILLDERKNAVFIRTIRGGFLSLEACSG